MLQTKCWATAAAAVVSIGWPGISAAATLNVPGDFATIQACIDAAVSGVDECVVAPGTYHETINFLGKAITVRSSGGADVTTIDATGIGGSVVTCSSGERSDTVLEGFTITGGTGTFSSYWQVYVGGGMFNDGTSPTVTNCTFSGNTAGFGGGVFSFGGAPTLSNCTFHENSADVGGAIYYQQARDAVVSGCVFARNAAVFDGGAVCTFQTTASFRNCLYTENYAGSKGGGMTTWELSEIHVSNSSFIGNRAAHSIGGMCNYRRITLALSDSVLWNNIDETGATEFAQIGGGDNVVVVDHTCIQGWTGRMGGVENHGNDPFFVPGPGGCYYLTQVAAGQGVDSPCVDSGSDTAGSLELDTATTRSDEGVDVGIVDIGYHYPITGNRLMMGDFDRNEQVDLRDLAAFQSCFTGDVFTYVSPCCRIFDFALDGDVDVRDAALLASAMTGP